MKPAIIFCMITSIFSQDGYGDYAKRIEEAVSQGKITRGQANEKYRELEKNLKYSGKRGSRTNDLSVRFESLGINNLDRIKHSLKEKGITNLQIESVLGGLLRVIHASKQVGNNTFNFDARMNRYFQDNCGLTVAQIDYVKNLSIKLSK